jgi:dihydroxyacetone kinase/dihydroxyacetone kinase-like protein
VLDLAEAHALFSLLRARFVEQRAHLNQLDGVIGDGDHGATMARAFQAVEHRLLAGDFEDLGELFDAVAATFAEHAGGAIGPLLAALLAEGGVVFEDQATVDLAAIVRFFARGLDAIEQVGRAERGDKTLLDALAPAVEALRAHRSEGVEPAFEAALVAAEEGVEATRSMTATQGRARFLGERAAGHPDPGATSVRLLFEACLDFLRGERVPPEAPAEGKSVAVPGKLVNDPHRMIQEELEGLALAHPRYLRTTEHPGVLARARPKEAGKVGLAIGHGGGHTPSMAGFVGEGLLDADAYGELFTCAAGVRIAEAIALADRGAGVMLLVSHHSGDVLNARLAVRRAEERGIAVRSVLLTDDVSTAPRARYRERRGLGGLLFALKVGGAAAEAGRALDEVVRLTERTNERTATLAVAVRPPTHPATGEPLFTLSPGEIEVGTGVHGESGVYAGPHLPADAIVELLLEQLVPDLEELIVADRLWAFVNGAGGTSMMELHIVYRGVVNALRRRGLRVADGVVNSYFTTQEMGGFSLSLCAPDDELLPWWEAPAHAPYFHHP